MTETKDTDKRRIQIKMQVISAGLRDGTYLGLITFFNCIVQKIIETYKLSPEIEFDTKMLRDLGNTLKFLNEASSILFGHSKGTVLVIKNGKILIPNSINYNKLKEIDLNELSNIMIDQTQTKKN